MNEILSGILGCVGGLAVGAVVAGLLAFRAGIENRKRTAEATIGSAEQEAERIRAQIKPASFTVAMCIEGKELSSEALAAKLGELGTRGISTVNFVVGSSFGLDESFKKSADLRLSMSPMTFPHHLARVMLAEQIYRACTINAGTQYHK